MTFSAFPIDADLGAAQLCPIEPEARWGLAEAIAAMPPWSTLDISAETVARVLASDEATARRYAVVAEGMPAGILSVRAPWLRGPYIELLAILPGHQGHGLGSDVLSFVETQALRAGDRNAWVCASQLNDRARRFYARHGFTEVASLPDLVADGFAEILLRKRLT